MEGCTETLKGNSLSWLLDPNNPSVRYWALVSLLDRPADDPEVLQARQDIVGQPLVEQVFNLQQPEGHWGDDPHKPYRAEGALGVLSLLHTLGVPPDERTARGCESLLHHAQNDCGGFSMVQTRRSGIFPCTTGLMLPMLVYFGLEDDPRVRKAFGYLIEDMSTPEALKCGRYGHQDCLWGAISALQALAVFPADQRSPCSDAVVRTLSGRLLDAPYDFQGEHSRWLTFAVSRSWDLISALHALALHGYGRDRRYAPLLVRVLTQQDEQGRWRCGSVSRTWPLEKRNQPSKWVTLDALRMLRAAGVKM